MQDVNVLVSRKLLLDWVNLQGSNQLIKKHPGLLNFLASDIEKRDRVVEDVQRSLRRAWEAEDERSRDWHFFIARWQYEMVHLEAEFAPILGKLARFTYPGAPPSNEPFHLAIFQLHKSGAVKRLRKCRFADCPEPYFIRGGKTKQPYCSTACHGLALREIKRRWWAKNRGKGAR